MCYRRIEYEEYLRAFYAANPAANPAPPVARTGQPPKTPILRHEPCSCDTNRPAAKDTDETTATPTNPAPVDGCFTFETQPETTDETTYNHGTTATPTNPAPVDGVDYLQ